MDQIHDAALLVTRLAPHLFQPAYSFGRCPFACCHLAMDENPDTASTVNIFAVAENITVTWTPSFFYSAILDIALFDRTMLALSST